MKRYQNSKPVILLTATIEPGGTSNTALQDASIRKLQYIEAIEFYLGETDLNIVFCENTGTDIFKEIDSKEKFDRLEYLTFVGNEQKNRGKGFGEANIIQHALINSRFLKDSDNLIKITGRVKVLNINDIIKNIKNKGNFIAFEGYKKDWIHSVCFVCQKEWISTVIAKYKGNLDDSTFNFQKMLYRGAIHSTERFYPIYPIIEGISGKTGRPYPNDRIIQRKLDNYNCIRHIYSRRSYRGKHIGATFLWLFYRLKRVL